jgi:transposase
MRRTQSLREKSDKPSGGQKGHPGQSIEFSKSPDCIEEHAVYYCRECGSELVFKAAVLLEERWSLDIPPIVPRLRLHRILGKQCDCGCFNKGQAPSYLRGHFSYGQNLKAMIGYFNTEQHIPYKRLCELFQDVFNLRLSEGTIYNLLKSLSNNAESLYREIRRRIEISPVVGADETGNYINGKLHWNWSFQTPRLTYIFSDESRGKAAINKHFPKGLPDSWLVTDRHSSYFSMNVKGNQICLAHLLRELTYLKELEPEADWPEQMMLLLREAIHKRKRKPWNLIDRKSILKKFEKLLFCPIKHLKQDVQNLQKGLIKHRDNVFRFLYNPGIPYDNNASERSIRPLKVKLKVSGGFRSNQGAQVYAILHSVADTARKNKQAPFVALKTIAREA